MPSQDACLTRTRYHHRRPQRSLAIRDLADNVTDSAVLISQRSWSAHCSLDSLGHSVVFGSGQQRGSSGQLADRTLARSGLRNRPTAATLAVHLDCFCHTASLEPQPTNQPTVAYFASAESLSQPCCPGFVTGVGNGLLLYVRISTLH